MNASRQIFYLTKICYYNRLTPFLRVLNAPRFDVKIHYKSTITSAPKTIVKGDKNGLVLKLLSKVPFLDINKIKLRASAYLLYEAVADKINYVEFFETFKLPDTFYTWFVITELHVWMLLARVMAEGENGQYIRNHIVQAMWDDVNTRVKKLGSGFASQVREQITELSEQFQATIISYDQGLQSSDIVLANALWRRVFQQKCDNPEDLEMMIAYVRKQMKMLDDLNTEQILYECQIKWSTLKR